MKIMKMLKLTVFESSSTRLLVRALIVKFLVRSPAGAPTWSTEGALGDRRAGDIALLQHNVAPGRAEAAAAELGDPAESRLPETLAKILSINLAVMRKQAGAAAGTGPAVVSKEDVLDVKLCIQCNAHGVVPPLLEAQEQAIGLALFPHTCMINHDCAPNAVQHFCFEKNRRPRLVIRATRAIAAGEEVCYNYVPLLQGASARQQLLSRSYGFECSCRKCVCHSASSHVCSPLLVQGATCFLNDGLMDAAAPGVRATTAELALWQHQCSQLIQESADQLARGGQAPEAAEDEHAAALWGTEVFPLAASVALRLEAVLLAPGGPAAGFDPLHSVWFQLHCVFGEACFKSGCTVLAMGDEEAASLRVLLSLLNRRVLRKAAASAVPGGAATADACVTDAAYDELCSQYAATEAGLELAQTLLAQFSRAGAFMLLAAAYVLGFAGHGRLYCSACLGTASRACRLVELLGELSRDLAAKNGRKKSRDTEEVSSVAEVGVWPWDECIRRINEGATVDAADVAALRSLDALDYPREQTSSAVASEPALLSEPEGGDGRLPINSRRCNELVTLMTGGAATESDQGTAFFGLDAVGADGFLRGYINARAGATRVLLALLLQWALDRPQRACVDGEQLLSASLAEVSLDEATRGRGLDSAQVAQARQQVLRVIDVVAV